MSSEISKKAVGPILLSAICANALALTAYQVTFNINTELQNVFVSAHEFNGDVYAWDLFPIALGTVPAGFHTYPLGSHDVVAWAIFANYGRTASATGINDSIDPPDGLAFETVFPGFLESDVASNTANLCPGGVYNVLPAYYLFDFVLLNEDTLKTDLATGTLHMFIFSNAVNVGTATIAVYVPPPPCPGDLTGDNTVDLGDLALLLSNYGKPSGATYAEGDLNGDDKIDLSDLAAILSLYGAVCP